MISQDVIEEAVAAPRCDHDLGDCSPAGRSFFCLPININLSPINTYVCRKSSILMPSLFVTLRGDNPGSWNIFNEYIHLSLELYLNLV